MKEENKKSKKKILLTYLILAACLLVIAAVTVTLIFTLNRPNDNLIEGNQPGGVQDDDKNNGGNEGNGDDKQPDKDPDKDEDDKPTNTDTTLCLPISTAAVTTRYDFAYDATLDRYCVHQGMDFEGTAGDSVCAVLDGTVTKVVTDSHIGENYVTISHANGMTSTYKYIEAKEGLKEGDSVKRGETIGAIATAGGYETKQGDHLHFELSVNGKTANPDTYLDIIEK